MNSRTALTAALLAAVLGTGAATPAVAEQTHPGHACLATTPLDTAALRQVLADLPNAATNAAIVRATGPAGCWTGAAGVADLDSGAPASTNARFRIGGVTKVFTAVVVLQLAAERRISLDGTVQEHLPGLLPADYPPVTVRHLLNYTSGLPSPSTPRSPATTRRSTARTCVATRSCRTASSVT